MFQENKVHQIFQKTNISYPLIRTRTCAYQEVRNVCFSENLAGFVFLKHRLEIRVCVTGGKKCSFFRKLVVLCFLEISVLRFALLPYYRRYKSLIQRRIKNPVEHLRWNFLPKFKYGIYIYIYIYTSWRDFHINDKLWKFWPDIWKSENILPVF